MSIRVLSPEVVEKIAAGEVVERPASVVKELVENSLDAGARSVHVEIIAGGCDLVRVADDGHGMTRDDLLLAVQRHATSKIASVEDLSAISTLGFRGEALASIAAVSSVTILSRQVGSPTAHLLKVEGGIQKEVAVASRATGTTITVERLFFNVPARRKFLRSAGSEAAQVAQLVSQFAVAYPEVSFELVVDGRRSLSTPGRGDPIDAALAVFGREVAAALLPLNVVVQMEHPSRGSAATIGGHIADPRVSRSNRSAIWLFVNRRAVRSRSLSYAVEDAYQTLLPAGRHPIAIIDLRVPPTEVDVNVHPSKSEVKLLRERLIYGGLRDAIREILSQGPAWAREMSLPDRGTAAMVPIDGQREIPRLIDASPQQGPAVPADTSTAGRRLPILRLMGQVAQTYIVAEGEQGLYLIDQHAAHERVLYHRLMRALNREENAQMLLEPIPLELAPAQMELALAARSELESIGFRLEPFGDGAVLVRGIPSELPAADAVRVLGESLEDLSSERPDGDWRERIAVALSCRGAVKAGQTLAIEEMRSLLEALEETEITQQCSHGRPTAILLSHQQLEREFGRR